MGRWGDEIYDSDSACEAYGLITRQIERELAFWLSPEQVTEDMGWLSNVFTVVELILLLKRSINGGDVFINNVQAVQRWREVFFSVWDGEWGNSDHSDGQNAYYALEYRKQHRAAVLQRFNDLEAIAQYWTDPIDGRPDSPPMPQNYPLPFYSFRYWTNHNNEELIIVERFIGDLIQYLENEIIVRLQLEGERRAWMDLDYVCVAVDQLALLSESYQQPSVTEQKVREWRNRHTEIWKQELEELFDETEILYQTELRVFDKLEIAAKKYPPSRWR